MMTTGCDNIANRGLAAVSLRCRAVLLPTLLVIGLLLPGQALAMGPYLSDLLNEFADTSRVDTCGDCHADWAGGGARADFAIAYKMWDYDQTKKTANYGYGMTAGLLAIAVFNDGVTLDEKVTLTEAWASTDNGATDTTISPYYDPASGLTMYPFLGGTDHDMDGCIRMYARTERAGMPLNIILANPDPGTSNGALVNPPECWDVDDNDPNNGNIGKGTTGWGTAYDADTLAAYYTTDNDSVSAGPIDDLRMSRLQDNAIPLSWSAPADDNPADDLYDPLKPGASQTVHHYDIRFTTEKIMNSFSPTGVEGVCGASGSKCDVRDLDHWHGMYDRSDCGLNGGSGVDFLRHVGVGTSASCALDIAGWNRGEVTPLMRAMYEPRPADTVGATEEYILGELGVIVYATWPTTGKFADANGRGVNYIANGQLYWLSGHADDGRLIPKLDSTFTGPFTGNGAAGFDEPGFSPHGNIIAVTAGGTGIGRSISTIDILGTTVWVGEPDVKFTVTGWGLNDVNIGFSLFNNEKKEPYDVGVDVECKVDARVANSAPDGSDTITVICPTFSLTPVGLYDLDAIDASAITTDNTRGVVASWLDVVDVGSDVLPGKVQFNQSVDYDINEDSTNVLGREVKLTREGGSTGRITVEFYIDDDLASGSNPATPGIDGDYLTTVYPQSAPLIVVWEDGDDLPKYINLSTTSSLTQNNKTYFNGVTLENLIIDDAIVDHLETLRVKLQKTTLNGVEDLSLLGDPLFIDSTLNLRDNESHGTINFLGSTLNTDEGDGDPALVTFDLPVDRSGGTVGEIKVDFIINTNVLGSATYGTDFVINAVAHPEFIFSDADGTGVGTLTWASGQLGTINIQIDVYGDYDIELDELVDVALTNPLFDGAIDPFDDILGINNTTTMTINNDDSNGTFDFEVDRTILEGDVNWTTTVTVIRTDGATGSVDVPIKLDLTTTALDSDYTITDPVLLSGVYILSFVQGDPVQSITINILADRIPETGADKFKRINFSMDSVNITGGGVPGSKTTMILTLQDDDSYGTIQYAAVYDMNTTNATEDDLLADRTFTFIAERADDDDGTIGNDGVVWADFSVISPQDPNLVLDQDYTISFDGVEGTDWTFDTASRSGQFFWADQSQLPRTITVVMLLDTIPEPGGEGIDVELAASADGGGGVSVGANSHAHGHIYDSIGTVQFEGAAVSQSEFDGFTPTVTMVVTRTGSRGEVVLTFLDQVLDTKHTATDGDDYTVSVPPSDGEYDDLNDIGTLVWIDGDGSNKSINVLIADDNLVEGTEKHIMQITNTTVDLGSGVSALNVIGAPATSTLSIADDDRAGTLRYDIAPLNVINVTENIVLLEGSQNTAGYYTLTIERINGQDGQVTVDYFIDTDLQSVPDSATYDQSKSGETTDGTVDFWVDATTNPEFVFNNTALTGVGTLVWDDQNKTSTAIRTIQLNIIDDTGIDPSEIIKILLQAISDDAPATGTEASIATIAAPADFQVNIFDDDAPGHIMFMTYDADTGASVYSTQEDNTLAVQAQIHVMRMGGTAGDIRVDYDSADGTATVAGGDYTAVTGTLLFPDGELGMKIIEITVNAETPYEPLETLTLTLSNPTLNKLQGDGILTDNKVLGVDDTYPGTMLATLEVTDSPGWLQFTTALQSITEGDVLPADTTDVIVNRYGGSGGTVGVDFLPVDGFTSTALADDYSIATASPLQWLEGEGGTSGNKAITITVTPDRTPEDDDIIDFDLANPSGGAALDGLAQLDHRHLIVNDDDGGTFNFVTVAAVINEDDASTLFDFVVQRVGGSDGDATVAYSITGLGSTPAAYGSDYDYSISVDVPGGDSLSMLNGAISGSGTLLFAEDVAARTIRVIVYDDAIAEALAESVELGLTGVTSTVGEGTTNIARLAATGLKATLVIGDAIGEILFSSPTNYDVNEYDSTDVPSTATVLVVAERVKGTRGQVAINYAVGGDAIKTTDYTIPATDTTTIGSVTYDELSSSGTLTWYDAQSGNIDIDITTQPDNDIEGDETITLLLDGLSISGGATLGLNAGADVLIIDNDIAGTFEFLTAASGSVSEFGSTTTAVTIRRRNGNDSTVTLDLVIDNFGIDAPASEADFTLYEITPGDIIFAGGVAQLSWVDGDNDKVLTLKAVDDNEVEADLETVQFKLANIGSPSGTAVLGGVTATTVGINNDDIAGTLQFTASTFFVDEATNSVQARIDVIRTVGNNGIITIDYSFSGATATGGTLGTGDYDNTVTSGTLTWEDQNSTGDTQSFFITINTDLDNEPGGEKINLALTNPTGFAIAGTQNWATLQINDAVGRVVFDNLAPVLNESDGSELAAYTYNIQINRIEGTYGTLPFRYFSRDGDSGNDAVVGADYNVVLGVDAFANTEVVSFLQLTILNDDDIEEPDEIMYLDLEYDPTNTSQWLPATSARVSIDSKDATGSVLFDIPPTIVQEGVGTVSIPLKRVNGKAGSYTVYVSTDIGTATSGADYTAINKKPISFANGVTTASFNLDILDDSSDEPSPDETVDLVIYGPDGTTELDRWTINIEDDDVVYSGVSIEPGWSMISIPTNLVQSNMLNLFYDDLKDNPIVIYKWNTAGTAGSFSGSYELAYSATIAQGYFVNNRTGDTTFLDDQYNGALTGDYAEFQLQVGGNMIGSPYPTDGVTTAHRDLLIASHATFCRIMEIPTIINCTLAGDWVDYSAAVANGWILNAIYRYNTVLGTYDIQSTANTAMTLSSWEGYWLRTEVKDDPATATVEVLKMRIYSPSVAP